MGQSWRPDARHSRMQVGQKWWPQLVIVLTDRLSRLQGNGGGEGGRWWWKGAARLCTVGLALCVRSCGALLACISSRTRWGRK